MAVLVMPMIQPRTSGVMYTLDPAASTAIDCLGIYAVTGLAEGLVDGSRTPEKYHVPREDDGSFSPTRPCQQDDSLLNNAELQQLKEWGMQLETHFGHPQDVEWALMTAV